MLPALSKYYSLNLSLYIGIPTLTYLLVSITDLYFNFIGEKAISSIALFALLILLVLFFFIFPLELILRKYKIIKTYLKVSKYSKFLIKITILLLIFNSAFWGYFICDWLFGPID